MTTKVAMVPTTSGSRYLQQLCKHWSHRFEVDFTAEEGRVALPLGTTVMRAHPEHLEVRIEAADAESATRAEEVVAKHLDRFAFREAPLTFAWQDG